ncbi:MAG: protein kinase [Crocinitomicaceae bacterium]|nr:protein kinase [Crocinitomicaceae bacterium]MCF8433518.1 protein kinase [Crocinitomicaceae bacterium]
MINKQLLSYKITSVLGEGGMGTVYLGEHTNFDRKVAIKAIHPHLAKNEEIRQRFKNEAATMARLQHPNIVSLYDYFTDDDGLYLIMELVEGVELESYLQNIGSPLDEHVSAAFMKQLLEAFSHAHDKGVVHRDIKPANILIMNDGTIKVLDFGIAKIVDGDGLHNMTKTGTQIGTVYYMSPEQVQGKKVDARSDIYSLGVTFYQMLTAQNPYSSCTTEFDVYSKIVQEPLPNPKEVNPAISDVIVSILNKATAKDPDARFQTCEQFKQALLKKEQQTLASSQKNNQNNSVGQNTTTTTSSGVATAALVLGIIGFVLCWFPLLNLILGILSLVFGIKGQKDSAGNKMSNAGAGVAGIVLGSITLFVTMVQLLSLLTRL